MGRFKKVRLTEKIENFCIYRRIFIVCAEYFKKRNIKMTILQEKVVINIFL